MIFWHVALVLSCVVAPVVVVVGLLPPVSVMLDLARCGWSTRTLWCSGGSCICHRVNFNGVRGISCGSGRCISCRHARSTSPSLN